MVLGPRYGTQHHPCTSVSESYREKTCKKRSVITIYLQATQPDVLQEQWVRGTAPIHVDMVFFNPRLSAIAVGSLSGG